MSNVRRVSAASVALALGVAFATPALASPARPAVGAPCFGHVPTIVVAGNGAHVKGTSHSDVILATGNGAVVDGGGGNDFICVKKAKAVNGGDGNDHIQFVSGTIHGGLGNDTLVQKPGGKAKIFGDGGNDAVSAVTAGDVVDTGTGLDTLTVKPSLLDRITIVDRDGLVVNGQSRRIDAPKGAPTADISYNGDPGPVVFAPTRSQSAVLSATDAVQFAHVLAPNGRTLTSWSVDFGDGYVRTGFGGLPATIRHPYLFDGRHTIVATQVDSSHKAVQRSIVVDTASPPSVSLSNGPSATDPHRNFTDSVEAGSGAAIASWVMDFGDGSAPSVGIGPPPTAFSHDYPMGNWIATLSVYDDHGNPESDTANPADVAPADPTARAIYLAATTRSLTFNAGLASAGVLDGPRVPLPSGGSVLTDQPVDLSLALSDSSTYDSYTLDWGDGCTSTNVDGPPTNHIGPCSGSALSHAYSGPGTRTITVTLGVVSQQPVSASLIVNVAARQTVAELQRVGVVGQGTVTMSTAGTTVAPGGAAWSFDPGDGRPYTYGYGAIPATFTHTYPSGVYFPSLTVRDHFGLQDSAEGFVDATSARARAFLSGADQSAWTAGLLSTDESGDNAVSLDGLIVPSNGARPKAAIVTFGDGSTPVTVHGVLDGSFGGPDAQHGYTKVGEVTAHLAVQDSKKQTAAATTHVSISGPVVLGPLSDVLNVDATHGGSSLPVNIPITVDTGANAGGEAYRIDWDGGSGADITGAYGVLPSILSRTYDNPGNGNTDTHNLVITYRNDHGSSATLRIRVVVHGA